MDKKLLFPKPDAADQLSISLRSLEYLIATKQLPSRRIGRRVLIPASALRAFANRDHPNPVSASEKTLPASEVRHAKL